MNGIGLMFPGQGAQRPGMGSAWRDTSSWAVVDDLSHAVGRDLAGLLLDADAETLRRTDNAQLAILAQELVILSELRARVPGLEPVTSACAGHSLGEYAALVAAGILTAADAARAVAARGAAMQAAAEAEPGTMAVLLGMEDAAIARFVAEASEAGHRVWPANINAPGQTVLSGTPEGIAALEGAVVAARTGKFVRIPVGGAFHSPLMAPALPVLREALSALTWHEGTAPVAANVDGCLHTGADDWVELLCRQLVGVVRWQRCVAALDEAGCSLLVEAGPGKALAGMARRISPGTRVMTIATPDDIDQLAENVASLADPEAALARR